MKLKSEDRVKVLEYKFVFEEAIQIKKELQEGSTDLEYRLSFFRKKLEDNTDICQQKLFDAIFLNNNQKENMDIVKHTKKQDLNNIDEKSQDIIKSWAKKMYKRIVMITHPDKTGGVGEHLSKQLTEQYLISRNAYENRIYSDLIMVAFDLNIEIPNGVISEEIIPSCKNKKKKMVEHKNHLGWKWYQVPEIQKDAELKKILNILGFKFTDKQVANVVKRKYIKRKTGTRPKKMNFRNRKLN
jgi:hypothetical protein